MGTLINPNPVVYHTAPRKRRAIDESIEGVGHEHADALEVFDMIRCINDPEHPLTLEQLKVVEESLCEVDDENNQVAVSFTPTIPHCSMATLIGLCIRVKLLRSLPSRFKVDIRVTPGSHASEREVNKQLNDKERVAAALENGALLGVVDNCIRVGKEREGAENDDGGDGKIDRGDRLPVSMHPMFGSQNDDPEHVSFI